MKKSIAALLYGVENCLCSVCVKQQFGGSLTEDKSLWDVMTTERFTHLSSLTRHFYTDIKLVNYISVKSYQKQIYFNKVKKLWDAEAEDETGTTEPRKLTIMERLTLPNNIDFISK